MEVLSKQIEFSANVAPFPLIPFNVGSKNRITRTLVKRGELVNILYRGDDAKLTFGKKSATKKASHILNLDKREHFYDLQITSRISTAFSSPT